MKIELHQIKIQEVVEGYIDSAEEGVVGYGGKLNIRPKYQREFVYNGHQRDAVIDTVRKNFPLNVMYWVKNGDEAFEMLDGQQRTISIAQYVAGDYSINGTYFHSLTDDQQAQILDYELMIYFCEGTDSEKLEWFKTINIAGEKLYDQELRNAIYTGQWLTDAKRHFSKGGCAAYNLAKDYMNGSPIRQDYLETAIKWINHGEIEEYMSRNQFEENATELWEYFQKVIEWVQTIFPKYRREMNGLEWGEMYNNHKKEKFDANKLESEIEKLMIDEDVNNKKGAYQYVLTGNEKFLNIREFTDRQKREAYERQKGICVWCKKRFEIDEMEADHIKPWHEGGKTDSKNCQMLCKQDNRTKSGK
jgi:hypothetical protein